MYRVSKSIKTKEYGVFESILEERPIVVDGSALDPQDNGTLSRYIIPAGTPMCPVASSGKYLPVRRTQVNGAANNETTITVTDIKPFVGGEGLGVYFFASCAATATLRTISSVTVATKLIALTAASTIADNEYIELALNGTHANSGSAAQAQLLDQVILKETVEVIAADASTTFDAVAVGVFRGAIKRTNVNAGQIDAGFDLLLKVSHPNISFLPVTPGTA
jgi:hypothetical protein